MTAVFSTERLIVRPWTHSEADHERIFDTYSRWEVARWLGSVPRALESRDDVPAVVDRWAARSDVDSSEAGRVPRYGVWAVQVRDTGVVAGTVLLVALPDPNGTGNGEVEVGWHFHPDSWGHGFATEAARGAITHGFAHGLKEVYAVVRPDNEKSLAVCRRLGMTPLGLTDRWYDTELEAFRIERT
jgi:RimJ/RimL family protein N-acetyltransferase